MQSTIMAFYGRLVHQHPLAMNTATGLCIAGLGDVTAQKLEGKKEICSKRFLAFSIHGMM